MQAALERLAAFLPELTDPDASFGVWHGFVEVAPGMKTMPWFDPSDLVDRFTEQAYRDGWVRTDLDWNAWAGTQTARAIAWDPAAIPGLEAEMLANLLTFYLRADRFSEGTLERAFETGMIRAIVEQAARLAARPPD